MVETQKASLNNLRISAAATDTAVSNLQLAAASRVELDKQLNNKLYSLEKSNAKIKAFTDTLVPADVSLMLNNARTRKTGSDNTAK